MKTIPASPPRRDINLRPLSDWSSVVAEEADRNVSLKGPFFLGLSALILGVGGFLSWAYLTPLAQASVAGGRVVVESNTKTVSHLEGGTLLEVVVKEGDHVVAQQVLVKLDATRSQALVTQLGQQIYSAKVRLARLTAERDGKTSFDVPPADNASVAPEFSEQVARNERRFMDERATLYKGQLGIDTSLIEQIVRQREALTMRLQSLQEQLGVAKTEHDTLKKLSEQGLATRGQVSEARLLLVDTQSQILQLQSQLAEGDEKKNQFELNRASRTSDFQRAIAEELQAAQLDISRLTQDLVTAQDVVDKSIVRAPQEGVIANIRIRTPGSAVVPGTPLLDIVPGDQRKIVEGVARASDIDTLRVGHKAEIRLSAFSAADAQPLIGEIIYLAPDSTVNPQTGELTYAFKAEIPDSELRKQPNLFLYPGMGADVYIVNGNRTALSYLLLPIKHSFAKAFREE
jgi:HlyD family secretion protein